VEGVGRLAAVGGRVGERADQVGELDDRARPAVQQEQRRGPGLGRADVQEVRRWYLVAWDLGRGDWRTFRVDRIQGPPSPPGARFAPRPLPADDVAAYVSQSIASAPYRYQARILFRASLADVAGRTSAAAGRLEAAGPDACILHTGSNSLDELALYVGLKGVDFQVLDPPELVPVLRLLAERLRRGGEASLPAVRRSCAPGRGSAGWRPR
jgi:hypothetical protein